MRNTFTPIDNAAINAADTLTLNSKPITTLNLNSPRFSAAWAAAAPDAENDWATAVTGFVGVGGDVAGVDGDAVGRGRGISTSGFD